MACLMHYADLDFESALTAAKACRPIIDPISHLGDLLRKFEATRKRAKLNPEIYQASLKTQVELTRETTYNKTHTNTKRRSRISSY